MKKTAGILLTVVLMCTVGCSKHDGRNGEKINVAIVLSVGGLGDNAYNDAAYRGLERAKRDFNMEFSSAEPDVPAESEQWIRQFAESGYDLIITTDFFMRDACENVAAQFPDTKFAIVDSVIDLPNVSSLLFKEHEGSFLVGALAGMMTESDTIGFVGGMDIPLITQFAYGYAQGARYTNPGITVLTEYIGGQVPFNDPAGGKEEAHVQIEAGADVVYHSAGTSGLGVIDACKKEDVWAIGVDTNQDALAEGTVLTSMVKHVDVAVYQTVQSVARGDFSGGKRYFGVREGGVGTTDFAFTRDQIPAAYRQRLADIKKQIKEEEITVEAYP